MPAISLSSSLRRHGGLPGIVVGLGFMVLGYCPPSVASAQVPAEQTSKAVSFKDIAAGRADDARLLKPVSVDSYRLYVGELLEKVASETGIGVSASDVDGAAGERVSVCCRNVPAYVVLGAVDELLSQDDAPYTWQRSQAVDGRFTYRLVRSAASRRFVSQFKADIQKGFEEQLLSRFALARMSAEERRERERSDPSLRLSAREEAGLAFLASTLDRDALLSVARGAPVNIPVSEANPAVQQYLAGEKSRYNPHGLPNVEPWQEPRAVGLEVGKHTDSELAPKFYITLERGGDGKGTLGSKEFFGWAGGRPLEMKYREGARRGWQGPRPAPAPEDLGARGPMPGAAGPGQNPDEANAAFASLRAFARATGVPVFARISHQSQFRSMPQGRTPMEYLEDLKAAGLDHKWHGTALLVTDYSWLQQPEAANPPWAVVRRLRERAGQTPHHGLTIDDYLYAALHLTPVQITAMWNDQNPWRLDYWGDMRFVGRLHPLLNLLARDTALRAKVAAAGEAPIRLSDLPAPLARMYRQATGGKADSFRLRVKQAEQPAGDGANDRRAIPTYSVTFSLLAPDGTPLHDEVASGDRWPPQKPRR